MKVIVIGCTHAGTAAVSKMAQLYKDIQITVYERNDNISFLSCGIALYVEGVVKDINGLFYSSPEKLAEMGVQTKMKHDVLSVDVNSKKVQVKNMITNEVFEDSYDKLVVTSGSWPINPNFEGRELENILLCKNFDHAKEIIEKSKNAKSVAVIGAGYIGIELIEAFEKQGKKVTIIDLESRILAKYLDKEFSDIAGNEYVGKDIKIALGEKVMKFVGDGKVAKVVTDKAEHEVDLVVLCIGFRPNTDIFRNQIDMLDNGAIIVDEYMHTSNPDVLAAGDSCAVFYNPTQKHMYIPLATNAVRMGTLAAINLVSNKIKQIGTQGTSGIKIFNQHIASTGLIEAEAKKHFDNVKSVLITENFRPEFMPSYVPVKLKLVYNADNRQILGAQLSSTADYTQTINTLSICIQNKMTVDEIAFVDQFFQPHFNKPWNLINTAGLSAE